MSGGSEGFVHGIGSAGAGAPIGLDRAAWDAVPDAVVVARTNGTVTFANPATTDLLGWSPPDLVGQPVDVLLDEAVRPVALTAEGRRDVDARHRDGRVVPVDLRVSTVAGAIVLVLRDRRPALAAAEQAAATAARREQVARLDALASLGGSVAHEFNNLLAVVLSSVDRLDGRVGDDEDLTRIREAAERGARLATQLAGGTIDDGPDDGGEPVDLLAVLDDVVRVLEWAGATVRTHRPAALPAVAGSSRAIERLLLALALDQAGVTEVPAAGGTIALVAAAGPGGRTVEVAVGRSPSTFAVTAAYAAVRRLGGTLEVDHADGGMVVRLVLPTAAASASAGPVVDVRPGVTTRKHIVLVVDDADALRELTALALRGAGYSVLEASAGDEALALLDGNVVDVVLTDVVMPRMSGLDLHEAVQLLPSPPALVFMSGYADSVLPADVPVLRKPFSTDELLEHVRRALAQPPIGSSNVTPHSSSR